MKKSVLFGVLFLVLIVLAGSRISYSFFKKIFYPSAMVSVPERAVERTKIEDIEDMIFIPEIKNFKENFLKKINTDQYIEIVIPENVLYLYRLNRRRNAFELFKKYPVSIGKPRTQTPIGDGMVYTKGSIIFKYQYGPKAGQVVTIGHDEYGGEFLIPYDSMFGLYMIVNQADCYVIHSTTEYWTTGGTVSAGCVRLLIPDMLDLYPYISPPIRVKIRYQLFTLDKDLLTIYPDVYRRSTNLYSALMEFLKASNINPIILNQDKVRKVLFGSLPETVSLDDMLDDYFVQRNIRFKDITLEYKNFLSEEKNIKIEPFTLQNK
jgi:lipoprotein-anchoring transpeptidase ErfK/SrfK